MKLSTRLTPLVAMGMLTSMYVTPAVSAEVTAGIGIANMYLWRGVNEGAQNSAAGGGQAQVSGELSAKLENGAYATAWLSSSGIGGSETDIIIGYAATNADIDWDVSYVTYLYPGAGLTDDNGETQYGLFDTNVAEIVGSIAYVGFSAGLYVNVDNNYDDDIYLTLGYEWSKYSVTFGQWFRDKSSGDEYSHLTLSYAATDALSFTVNKAFTDKSRQQGGVENDPLFQVSYGWSFDLKKK
ncbi:MAG: TorF family putative porin [Thiohalomonadales bacterium]